MLKFVHSFLLLTLVLVASRSVAAKQIRLLDGQLSLNTPVEMSASTRQRKQSDRYSVLIDLDARNHSLSVNVTYGRHTLQKPDIGDFLRHKVSSYGQSAVLPHFHWIEHRVVERDGQQCAEVRFSHDNDNGAHVYTRCLSCFIHGRLIEVWALTRRADDAKHTALVDRLIGSVHLRQ
jgi:hypothetical protein